MRLPATVLILAVLSGCTGAPTGPKASTRPTGARATATPPSRPIDPATLSAVTLTGKVKIISDNGGGIISNNTGGIVANNGGAYRVRQLARLAEAALADAVVTLKDAAGKPVTDAAGKPITATSDREGRYVIQAALPPGNVVVEARLWNGGTLSAIAAQGRGAAALDLDTASSIGATYVLSRFVKGSQATLDKLPASEAARLQAELLAAQGLIEAAPRYEQAELVALGDGLRQRAPALDKTLADIQALLIGQANLGAGRLATEVPLSNPSALAYAADGTLYVAEPFLGRIRAIAPDGTIATWADAARGVVRQNFKSANDLAVGPDGSVYVNTEQDFRVHRIWPDHHVTPAAGLGPTVGPLGGPAADAGLKPSAIAVGPDGTLYVAGAGAAGGAARVVAVGADGLAKPAFEGGLPGGIVSGLAVLPGGGFAYVEHSGNDQSYAERIVRRAADGTETKLQEGNLTGNDLTVGADGTIFVTSLWGNAVWAWGPDNVKRLVGDAAAGLEYPSALTTAPGGGLAVVCSGRSTVEGLPAAGGALKRLGGTTTVPVSTGELTDLPLNGPASAVFDAQGRLVVCEDATGVLKRLENGAFTRIAGGVPWGTAASDFANDGAGGEGVDALKASLKSPRALARSGDDILIADTGNARVRTLAADGTIRTTIGQPGWAFYQDEGYPVDHPYHPHPGATFTLPATGDLAPELALVGGMGVAVGPDGSIYTHTRRNQVVRRRPDGRVALVAGKPYTEPVNTESSLSAFNPFPPRTPGASRALAPMGALAFGPDGALYVAETLGLRLFKIEDPAGATPTMTTVAGLSMTQVLALTPDARADADGTPALDAVVSAPVAIAFGPDGRLYYSELGSVSAGAITTYFAAGFPLPEGTQQTYPRVRRIEADGTVTTIAGPGGRYFADPTAEDALALPTGLTFDPAGRLVIVDGGANLVRILPSGSF